MPTHNTDITLLLLEHKTLISDICRNLLQLYQKGNCMESFRFFFPEVLQRVRWWEVGPLKQSRGVFRYRKANSEASCSVKACWLEGLKYG